MQKANIVKYSISRLRTKQTKILRSMLKTLLLFGHCAITPSRLGKDDIQLLLVSKIFLCFHWTIQNLVKENAHSSIHYGLCIIGTHALTRRSTVQQQRLGLEHWHTFSKKGLSQPRGMPGESRGTRCSGHGPTGSALMTQDQGQKNSERRVSVYRINSGMLLSAHKMKELKN